MVAGEENDTQCPEHMTFQATSDLGVVIGGEMVVGESLSVFQLVFSAVF